TSARCTASRPPASVGDSTPSAGSSACPGVNQPYSTMIESSSQRMRRIACSASRTVPGRAMATSASVAANRYSACGGHQGSSTAMAARQDRRITGCMRIPKQTAPLGGAVSFHLATSGSTQLLQQLLGLALLGLIPFREHLVEDAAGA